MVRLSAQKLKPDVENEIHTRFVSLLLDLTKNKEGRVFLEELFTNAEQLMLAKRVSTLFLLAQDFSPYRVARILKVSDATTEKYARELDGGKYKYLRSFALAHKNDKKFWDDLEVLLRCGLPPRGKGRWKRFHEIYGK